MDTGPPIIRLMRPDGTSEVITQEELTARERAARTAAAPPGSSAAMAEELARQRSRRGV